MNTGEQHFMAAADVFGVMEYDLQPLLQCMQDWQASLTEALEVDRLNPVCLRPGSALARLRRRPSMLRRRPASKHGPDNGRRWPPRNRWLNKIASNPTLQEVVNVQGRWMR